MSTEYSAHSSAEVSLCRWHSTIGQLIASVKRRYATPAAATMRAAAGTIETPQPAAIMISAVSYWSTSSMFDSVMPRCWIWSSTWSARLGRGLLV